MRQIVVMTVMVGLCLSALPAQAQTGPLREAAARAWWSPRMAPWWSGKDDED